MHGRSGMTMTMPRGGAAKKQQIKGKGEDYEKRGEGQRGGGGGEGGLGFEHS